MNIESIKAVKNDIIIDPATTISCSPVGDLSSMSGSTGLVHEIPAVIPWQHAPRPTYMASTFLAAVHRGAVKPPVVRWCRMSFRFSCCHVYCALITG